METKTIVAQGAITGFLGALGTFFYGAPDMVAAGVIVLTLLIITDSYTGSTSAHVHGVASSSVAREKLAIKVKQYGAVLTVFLCLSIVLYFFLHEAPGLCWGPFLCALLNLCAIETRSIEENISALQEKGVKIIGLSTLMTRVESLFSAIGNALMKQSEDKATEPKPAPESQPATEAPQDDKERKKL